MPENPNSSATRPSTQGKSETLTGRVARGAAWIMGAGFAARILGAINMIVVARLLAPGDIGLVAVATITMQLLQGFSDIGVSQAVVKFRDADRDDLNTLFTLAVLRGLLIGVLLACAAPFAAAFYEDPRMLWAFFGVACFPVIMGFLNPRFFEFERDLKFSREFITTILNRVAGVTVSISIAVIFRTYWAIILGMLAGGLVQLFLSYLLRPFLPRISFRSFRKVFGFSSWLAGVSFLAALNNKLDVPILARIAGAGGAGFYFMGLQLSEMITGQLAAPLTRAIYPGLSALQSDVERMRQAFLRGVSALGAFAMPIAFGFAFVAEDLTALLLGEKWMPVIPVIQILAPVVGLQALFYATQPYAVALGLTRLVFFRELIFFIIRFPVFVWAAVNHGLRGAVIAAAVLGLFHVVLNLALYSRASGRPFWDPLNSARRSFAAVACMTAYFIFIQPRLSMLAAQQLPVRLIADVLIGGGIYVMAHLSFWSLEGRPDSVEKRVLGAISAFSRRLSKF